MFFTAYASFTNYGTGHLGDKESSIAAIQSQTVVPVEGGTEYAVVPDRQGRRRSRCWSPTRRPGRCRIGTNEGLTPVADADVQRTGEQGHRRHRIPEPEPRHPGRQRRTTRPSGTRCSPRSTRTKGIYLRAHVGHQGRGGPAGLRVRRGPGRHGQHGDRRGLPGRQRRSATSSPPRARSSIPGWKVGVGFKNYTKLFTDPTVRHRFLPITAVDVRLRDPDHDPELRPRADPGAGAQRAPDARPEDLPVAADRALRPAVHPHRAGLEGHAQHRLRPDQPDPRQLNVPWLDERLAGQVLHPGGEPVGWASRTSSWSARAR